MCLECGAACVYVCMSVCVCVCVRYVRRTVTLASFPGPHFIWLHEAFVQPYEAGPGNEATEMPCHPVRDRQGRTGPNNKELCSNKKTANM